MIMIWDEEEICANYLHNDFAITKPLKEYIELQKYTGEIKENKIKQISMF